MPQSDQIAAIVWVREQRTKGPSEADWINQGNGWVLGAYRRTQVPPDAIDKVRGIEIVPASSIHRWTCVWLMPPSFRLMTRARIWRWPLCRFKISTGYLPPFEKQRAFWNQAGDFAWR
jgi:hypothetical protein